MFRNLCTTIKDIYTKRFKHAPMLLYWIFFGIVFWGMEIFRTEGYHVVHCALDDMIPFCEYFVIPYYFWFIFLIGIMVYGFFFDVPTFKNYMKFTMITYTITLIIYTIFPTSQELRPTVVPRNNIFCNIVRYMYAHDTNTNVCPSIHVLGSFAVYFAARKSKAFSSLGWRTAFLIMTVIISISTVFLKQHSALDVLWALIIIAISYPFVYCKRNIKQREYAYTGGKI